MRHAWSFKHSFPLPQAHNSCNQIWSVSSLLSHESPFTRDVTQQYGSLKKPFVSTPNKVNLLRNQSAFKDLQCILPIIVQLHQLQSKKGIVAPHKPSTSSQERQYCHLLEFLQVPHHPKLEIYHHLPIWAKNTFIKMTAAVRSPPTSDGKLKMSNKCWLGHCEEKKYLP